MTSTDTDTGCEGWLVRLYRRLNGYKSQSVALCPVCRFKLNGDFSSFQGYDRRGMMQFSCSMCGHHSAWRLNAQTLEAAP